MKKYWKPITVFVVLLLVVLYQWQKYRLAPKSEIFGLTYTDTSGKPVKLVSYKGKKILFSYYANWCGDCLGEMKTLNESVEAGNLKDLTIICVSDEPMEKIKRFAKRKNYPFLFWKLDKPFNEINVYSIPVNYLINPAGEITYSKVGAVNWRDPSMLAFAQEHLK